MTVSSTHSRWSYMGDGSTTEFFFTGRIFAAADIKVFVDGVLKADTNYAISGVGGANGGKVIFTVAPSSGSEVVLLRDVAATQVLNMVSLGSFPAEENEKALDRLTILIQQLEEQDQRALRQPASDAVAIAELPGTASRAQRVLAFDADGHPIASSMSLTQIENGAVTAVEQVALATAKAAEASSSATSASAAAVSAAASAATATSAQADAAVSEANAAASAILAASTLASALWRNVIRITSVDSPFAVTAVHNGDLIVADTTGGPIAIDLPPIASLTEPFNIGTKLEAGSSDLTVNRGGSDTVAGGMSLTLTGAGPGYELIADPNVSATEWGTLPFGGSAITGSDGIQVVGSTARLDISSLAEDSAPDVVADFGVTFDTSAGTHKKVKLRNIGGAECFYGLRLTPDGTLLVDYGVDGTFNIADYDGWSMSRAGKTFAFDNANNLTLIA